MGALIPARGVCLLTLSLSEAEPGRVGGQLSFTDFYHAILTIPQESVCSWYTVGINIFLRHRWESNPLGVLQAPSTQPVYHTMVVATVDTSACRTCGMIRPCYRFNGVAPTCPASWP